MPIFTAKLPTFSACPEVYWSRISKIDEIVAIVALIVSTIDLVRSLTNSFKLFLY